MLDPRYDENYDAPDDGMGCISSFLLYWFITGMVGGLLLIIINFRNIVTAIFGNPLTLKIETFMIKHETDFAIILLVMVMGFIITMIVDD
jgi:hypothetical protein